LGVVFWVVVGLPGFCMLWVLLCCGVLLVSLSVMLVFTVLIVAG
jgi:hypothetical protein